MVWMGLHKSTLTATVANSLVEPQDAGAKSRGLLFPSTLGRKLLIRHQQDAQAPSLPPVKVDVVLWDIIGKKKANVIMVKVFT